VSDDVTLIYHQKIDWRSIYYLHMSFWFRSLWGRVYALCTVSVVSCDQEWVFEVCRAKVLGLLYLAVLLFIEVWTHLILPSSCGTLWTSLPQIYTPLCLAHDWILVGCPTWHSVGRLTDAPNGIKQIILHQYSLKNIWQPQHLRKLYP
jgi:hypothetical protein